MSLNETSIHVKFNNHCECSQTLYLKEKFLCSYSKIKSNEKAKNNDLGIYCKLS